MRLRFNKYAGAAAVLLLVLVIAKRRAIENMMIPINENTLNNANVKAFLRMIRVGEGTADALGYQRLFGHRSGAQFSDFSDHPRVRKYEGFDGQFIKNGKIDYTTAAGAYQITATTWDKDPESDFSPRNQDRRAVKLIRGRGALLDVMQGRFDAAIAKCNKEWASLPGSPYGQPVVTMADARSNFQKYGGVIA